MLSTELKEQLKQYLSLVENNIVIKQHIGDNYASSEVKELIDEVTSLSDKIKVEDALFERVPCLSINRIGEDTGVLFAGVPLGHEFTSFVLALLQVSGRAPKVSDEIINRVKGISSKLDFVTYVSLSCHNCPDVVQALNLMALLNSNITHTMVEGGSFQEEVKEKSIMAVPTTFCNGEHFVSGRTDIEDILKKLGQNKDETYFQNKGKFEVLVIGGGPSGASAAIYAARKGLKTGIVAERFGGQVMETMSIENFISVKETEGPLLSRQLEEHVKQYDIDIITGEQAKELKVSNGDVEIVLDNGATLTSKSIIISTGAKWRKLGVPGEKEFQNKGVAYCPHCDGPLYKGKNIAVVGGGNSGVEAAIDLANIVSHVTLLEFLPELKADAVLREKLKSLPNVTVVTDAQVTEISGNQKVEKLHYTNRKTSEQVTIDLEGIFVQIGLQPNTEWLEGSIQRNRIGEIEVNKAGVTNVKGVFAAGDCTNTPYKQIIIAMGSGATAALSAFDYLIRRED